MNAHATVTLECDHCGGVAITSEKDGLFSDGQGERCETCGFPGSVSIEDEDDEGFADAYWNMGQEHSDVCADMSCVECEQFRELRA